MTTGNLTENPCIRHEVGTRSRPKIPKSLFGGTIAKVVLIRFVHSILTHTTLFLCDRNGVHRVPLSSKQFILEGSSSFFQISSHISICTSLSSKMAFSAWQPSNCFLGFRKIQRIAFVHWSGINATVVNRSTARELVQKVL